MTVRDMAAKWLETVRRDILRLQNELAQLRRHEAECVKALADDADKLDRIKEIVDD